MQGKSVCIEFAAVHINAIKVLKCVKSEIHNRIAFLGAVFTTPLSNKNVTHFTSFGC